MARVDHHLSAYRGMPFATGKGFGEASCKRILERMERIGLLLILPVFHRDRVERQIRPEIA